VQQSLTVPTPPPPTDSFGPNVRPCPSSDPVIRYQQSDDGGQTLPGPCVTTQGSGEVADGGI